MSSNQQGGVTAYYIGQVNYLQAPVSDPQTRQLAGILEAHQLERMRGDLTVSGSPSYTLLIQNPESDVLSRRMADEAYFLFIQRQPLGPLRTICPTSSGIWVGGIALNIAPTGPEDGLRVRELDALDANLFQPLCHGLTRTLGSLPPSSWIRQRDARENSTIFDALAGPGGTFSLELMPAIVRGRAMESLRIRYFWADALAKRYYRDPSVADRENENLALAEPDAASLEEIRSGIAWIPNLPSGEGLGAYPTEARMEFGDLIGRLDAQWLAFLTQSGLTIQGQRRPLMIGNRMARLLPRFSRLELGSSEFWLAAMDVRRSYEMADCIAGRFLMHHGYRSEPGPVEASRCLPQETVLTQTPGG
jgi:hypothetical protein